MCSASQQLAMNMSDYITQFHSKLNQLGIAHPTLDTQSLTMDHWISMLLLVATYFASKLLSHKKLVKGSFQSIFTPLSYFSKVLFYTPLLFFSLNFKENMEPEVWEFNLFKFNQQLFHYLMVSLMIFDMLISPLKILSKQSMYAENFYNLYAAIPWAYTAIFYPHYFNKMATLELIYQTINNSLQFLKQFPSASFVKYLFPLLFTYRILQHSVMIYFNIINLYTPQQGSAFFWSNQVLIICNILALLKTAENFLRAYTTQFRNAMTVFLVTFHIFAIIGLGHIYYSPHSLRLSLEVLALYMITGLGITCGAHRLWSHRAYKAHWTFRLMLMILNSISNQGTIYHWSRDHRVHHKYSEREGDPHNATRGFFYSHMGWLILKKPEAVKLAGQDMDCSDLLEDPIVRFQKKFDPYWNQTLCFVLPALYGHYVHGNFWTGFFVLGTLRWVICLHATWTVNSVAHMWGDRPYNPNINPAESFITSILAVGEGWHNWHHEYPYDYAAAEGGIYTHWNPSKILIDLAAKLNLVYDRKRALTVWKKVQARRLQEEKKIAENVVEELKKNPSISKLPNFKDSLPAHVVQKSFILSSLSALRDLIACSLLIGLAWYLRHYPIYLLPTQWALTNALISIVCWSLYAFLQGTVAFGIWVLGYEAAGGRYCNSRVLNHIVGATLHSLLLIPYRPRRRHREKEREKASLLITLSDSQFGIFKTTLVELNSFGGVILSMFVAFYAYYIKIAGFGIFFHLFIGPWIVLNTWLFLYEWTLENGPQNTFEIDLNENYWQLFTGDFLLKYWPKYSRENKYYVARFIIDFLHHNLSLSHIVQAVDFNVPHYHLKEAFFRLGDLLGDVTNEVKGAKNHLVGNKIYNQNQNLFEQQNRTQSN